MDKSKKERKIPKQYTAGLSPSDKKKQIKSIRESRNYIKKDNLKIDLN